MKAPQRTIARNVDTGEERDITLPPQVYTSVHQWKPVQPDRFLHLLHAYSTSDENLDEFNNGLMRAKSFHLDRTALATIWYSVKEVDSPVSSPVLMTMSYATGKVICFASTQFGAEAQPDRPS